MTANEILVAVFGRAGFQSYYSRNMINNIGFVIFDTVTESVRIAGVQWSTSLVRALMLTYMPSSSPLGIKTIATKALLSTVLM